MANDENYKYNISLCVCKLFASHILLDRKPHSNVRESHLVLFILVLFVCWEKKHPPHRQLVNPFQGLWPLSNRFSTVCQNIDGHIQAFSAYRFRELFTIFFFSNSTTAWLPVVTFLIGRLSDPREARQSHMYLMFILSDGPICLSKCVCCVLFPAWFVPKPFLWAPFSPEEVWATRYL